MCGVIWGGNGMRDFKIVNSIVPCGYRIIQGLRALAANVVFARVDGVILMETEEVG